MINRFKFETIIKLQDIYNTKNTNLLINIIVVSIFNKIKYKYIFYI